MSLPIGNEERTLGTDSSGDKARTPWSNPAIMLSAPAAGLAGRTSSESPRPTVKGWKMHYGLRVPPYGEMGGGLWATFRLPPELRSNR
jgi:hypothetical protein